MKGSALSLFLTIICILVVAGMIGFIVLKGSHQQLTGTTNSPSVTPPVNVKDFAPNVPMSQKTTILIQLSDSSLEKYIVPKDQVNMYIKSLPQGDHVVSKSP